MALVRMLPYRSHWLMQRELDNARRVMESLGGDIGQGRTPACDVHRDNGEIVIEMDLPGRSPEEDIDIEVDSGVLAIRSRHDEEREQNTEGFYLKERRRQSFERTFVLPEGVNPDDIRADYTDGVLAVRFPAPSEEEEKQQERRKISVGSGASTSVVDVGKSSDPQPDSD
jgi:HSP20 family protein